MNDEYKVYVIYGSTKKCLDFLNDYYHENYTEKELDNCRGKAFSQESCHPTVWLNLDNEHIYATIAHEAVHAVNDIWKAIFETYKNEAFAHSVGAIVRAVEDNLIYKKK